MAWFDFRLFNLLIFLLYDYRVTKLFFQRYYKDAVAYHREYYDESNFEMSIDKESSTPTIKFGNANFASPGLYHDFALSIFCSYQILYFYFKLVNMRSFVNLYFYKFIFFIFYFVNISRLIYSLIII